MPKSPTNSESEIPMFPSENEMHCAPEKKSTKQKKQLLA
jgi:hypothetical protein